MRANSVEVVVGAAVLLISSIFLGIAYKSSQWQGGGAYSLHGNFDRVDGLSIGSDVRISGVKVGHVSKIDLDPTMFTAKVSLSLLKTVKVPKDSTGEIVADGLLGPKYLSIRPGNEEEDIPPGGKISRTQPSVSLESLIGKFLFNKNEDKQSEKK